MQQLLASEEGGRRGAHEQASKAAADAAESAGQASEARARADALQKEVESLRARLDKAVAAQQQEGVNQVSRLGPTHRRDPAALDGVAHTTPLTHHSHIR